MIKRIFAFFLQPAPAVQKPWVITLVVTAVVFFLLFMLLRIPDDALRWKAIIEFSLVTALITLLWGYVFPEIFRRFYAVNSWVIWKMLVNNMAIIFMISIGNTFLDFFLFDRKPEALPELFTSYILVTLLIGVLPAIIASLMVSNYQLKHNLQHSAEINARLSSKAMSQKTETMTPTEGVIESPAKILLKGTTKEMVELSPDDLIYIETSGNYLLINYLSNEGKLKQKSIRNTIGYIEKTLESYPRIVRCHRGFMVNLPYIISADGNAQGLQLKLSCVNQTIPVSRNFIPVIRKKLSE